MTEPERNDRIQRIVLVALIVIAFATAAAAIFSTMGEWDDTPPDMNGGAPGAAQTL